MIWRPARFRLLRLQGQSPEHPSGTATEPADYPTRCFTVTTSNDDEQITVTAKSDSNTGQQWITKQSKYSTSYPWHIVNVMSSKALDMAGNNTTVMPLQWTSENDYNGGKANVNQEWKFDEVDATQHTYKIYAYTQNQTYYLTYDGTDGGKLGRTTDSNSATAFGFIKVEGSTGGGRLFPCVPHHITIFSRLPCERNGTQPNLARQLYGHIPYAHIHYGHRV